jgi:hypothetical protein
MREDDMNFVYIKNGVVVDKAQIEPEKVFFQPYASQFIEAPENVDLGWLYDGANFTEPKIQEVVSTPAPTKEELLAQVQVLTAQIQALT